MLLDIMSEADFTEKYKPVWNPDDDLLLEWTRDQIVNVDDHYVWSIVMLDSESEILVLPGTGYLKTIEYSVTEVPWESLEIAAIWWPAVGDEDDEEEYRHWDILR